MCSSADGVKNNQFSAHASQKWLIVLLFIWLFLSIARQAFDLIGKLWIPVAFNLLQLLACISGLFAAFQCRFGLLISLSISTVVSLTYNTLLLLWYANWLGDRQSAVLSAGLHFGHSFFLRHTPLCGSHFNLTTSQWQQSFNCVLPYYTIEGIQALLHIVVAILTLFFSILTLAGGKRQEQAGSENKKKRNQGLKITAPDSINDLSSGYMNSSYESAVEGGAGGRAAAIASTRRPPFSIGPMLSNSQRRVINSSRRQNKGVGQKPSKTMQSNTLDEYSSATTADLGGSSNKSNSSTESHSLPLPPVMAPPPATVSNYSSRIYARSQHTNGSSRYNKAAANNSNQQPPRAHSSMAATRSHTESEEEEVYVSPSQTTKEAPYYSHPKAINKLGGSLRVSQANNAAAKNSGYLEYLGRNEERRNSANNLTSLVSFDPKSNTLIRVREHQNDSSDEEENIRVQQSGCDLTAENSQLEYLAAPLKSGSQDSMPSIKAPVLIPNSLRSSMPEAQQGIQPLRQRMPPPGIDLRHEALEKEEEIKGGSQTTQTYSPDWTQAGISHLNPPLPISTFLPSMRASKVEGNNSMYECVGGYRPVPSTAFPVSQHQRQRSVTGISVASAVTLRPADNQKDQVPISNHYKSTFLGLNQERNAKSTTFPNSFFDVRDNRSSNTSSNPVIFPCNDGSGHGLLV